MPRPPYPQSALETLRTSIEAQEWETAARSCARALAVPTDVLNGPFAARVVVRPPHSFPFNCRAREWALSSGFQKVV